MKVGEIVDIGSIIYHKNRKSFVDVCHGRFGRKVIYTNSKTISKSNVLEILSKSLSIHNQNRREIDYLYHYTNGDQPILYRAKDVRPDIKNNIVENHALEIMRFMTAQMYGEPIQYVSVNNDEEKTKEIDALNNIMKVLDKASDDVLLGDWQSTAGTAYREVWSKLRREVDPGEPLMGIDVSDPRSNFIIYSSTHGHRKMMSVSICEDEKGESYYLCTTDNHVYEIKGENVEETINGYGRVLLTEYPNNHRRLSDIEIVITMLDGINKIQSNRIDGIEQFVQAFMKFVNCEIDEDTFLKMCKLGALKVKTVNPSFPADVGMISEQLDQQQTQTAKDDLYKNALIIEGMPNREQNTGGDTGQAVYLRNGWDFAEQRAKIDEPLTIKSEKDFLRNVLLILKRKQQISKELTIADIDVKITRNKTDNMLVKAQALLYLLEKGIHPKIAIKTCDLWGDPEKVYVQSKEYLDVLYKTAAEKQIEYEKEKQSTLELAKLTKGGVENSGNKV
ncbi:MAG: phage portal protein [Clostridium sp.]|uniref:phage portal protein n=1 Tax=Faecalicatena contorta TaxID=39482 RepID=UPI0004ADAF82|nr:phage portal protein [Clostridium sp.]MEE0200786.1 phage portal protein [Muricomes sp.]